jgi:hypothetical protein
LLNQQPANDDLIIQYLLGTLSAEEAERLDELSFTDDEFAGRLQIVENDLVDAYVRGELSGQRLEKFNSVYLTSPKRRERVRFAKTFQSFSNQPSTLQTETPRSFGIADEGSHKLVERDSTWRRFFTIPRLALQWGLAAATLLLILAGGYLLVENARLRNQITAVQAEREGLQKRQQELQTALANQRQADVETVSELARVRERLAELERQQPSAPKNEKPEPDLPKVATMTLAPQLRSTGQIAKVNVPVGTTIVALQLELETNDFSTYQAALKNPGTGQIIWRSGKLKTSGKTIPVRIRAALLQPQNYTLELSGISANGSSDIVGSYTFKVEKP